MPYPNLNLLASRYSSINSMPIQRRPSRSATMPAVLDPAKGSITTSPSSVSGLMKNSGNAAGKQAG